MEKLKEILKLNIRILKRLIILMSLIMVLDSKKKILTLSSLKISFPQANLSPVELQL